MCIENRESEFDGTERTGNVAGPGFAHDRCMYLLRSGGATIENIMKKEKRIHTPVIGG